MKKLRFLVIAIAMATSFSLHADHDTPSYESWVGGFVEYYLPDDDNPDPQGYLDNGFGLGGEYGYRFTPEWAARLEISNLDLDTERENLLGRSPNNAGWKYGADALYFLNQESLFVFAGLRKINVGDNYEAANVGVGKHWFLNDKWRIISEAAFYQGLGDSYSELGLKLGVAYIFGAKAHSAQPKDSDNDGVFDSQDQCPGTPAGTRVDSRGCDIDSDKDGVINSLDQCPNTPAGTKVDVNGCNQDSDGDGVLNSLDKCPNTPKGTPVGAKGCSLALDSDQDGVLDADDKCANTPLTDKVDAIGCSVFTEQEVSVSLQVMFANNSAEINNPADSQFQEFADFMQRFPNTQAVIEGHSSAQGPADYNQQLSERRANAVRQLLIDDYALAANRLSAVGYGETRLLDQANTAEAHRINRRIEAKVTAMQTVKEQR